MICITEGRNVRLFIGIKLTNQIQGLLGNLQEELGEELVEVRWVPIENLHITLKFLGNCDQGKVQGIAKVMDGLREYLPYHVRIGGVGGFPSQGSARIIWVGVDDPRDVTREIYRRCENGCMKLGFEKEKRNYHPHITIGRSRRRTVRLPWSGLREGEEGVLHTVGGITLFRSELETTGAKYSVIHEAKV